MSDGGLPVQAFAALSMLGITIVTLVVGVRLLVAWRRTRGLPELLFGIAFVGSGIGMAGIQLGMRVLWGGSVWAGPVNTALFAFQIASTAALYVVNWRLWRPGRGWAMALCLAGCSLALVGYAVRILDGDFPTNEVHTRGVALFQVLRFVVMVWASAEAFAHYAQLRRRLRLGLADPVAANQILLWAVAGVATASTTLIISMCIFGLGAHPLEVPVALVALTLLALVLSASMWCAFFPPAALRRHLEARAAALA